MSERMSKPNPPTAWEAATQVRLGLTVEEATAHVFRAYRERLDAWVEWYLPFGPQSGAVRDHLRARNYATAVIVGVEVPPADPYKGTWRQQVEVLAAR